MVIMASSSYYQFGLGVAVTVLCIFPLIILPSVSAGLASSYRESLQRKKVMLGSRPPACVNKCMNCKPCKATLVIPQHHKAKVYTISSHREDDTYYLVSWKCMCGNKLFQP